MLKLRWSKQANIELSRAVSVAENLSCARIIHRKKLISKPTPDVS